VSLACREKHSVSNMTSALDCVIHGLHTMHSFKKIYIRTYHRQNPVHFMVRTTVRILYTSWYVPPSEPCTHHGTYHRQNPVHFVVRTTVRTLYTSWYVPPSEPCTLHGTYHRQNPVHFMVSTTVRTLYTSLYVPP